MSRKLLFRQLSVSSVERSQRFLINEDYYSSSAAVSSRKSGGKGSRFAEVAGGTAAECAAVCCCCPCGLADLLFLAIYRVPAGLCRKALRRKRERWLMKRGGGGIIRPDRIQRCECGCDDSEMSSPSALSAAVAESMLSAQLDKDVVELEKQMWDHFYSAGFGRSISQRIITSSPIIEVI